MHTSYVSCFVFGLNSSSQVMVLVFHGSTVMLLLLCNLSVVCCLGRGSVSLSRQMNSIMSELSTDKATRVLILRSIIPGVFCAGADLKERVKFTEDEV